MRMVGFNVCSYSALFPVFVQTAQPAVAGPCSFFHCKSGFLIMAITKRCLFAWPILCSNNTFLKHLLPQRVTYRRSMLRA